MLQLEFGWYSPFSDRYDCTITLVVTHIDFDPGHISMTGWGVENGGPVDFDVDVSKFVVVSEVEVAGAYGDVDENDLVDCVIALDNKYESIVLGDGEEEEREEGEEYTDGADGADGVDEDKDDKNVCP